MKDNQMVSCPKCHMYATPWGNGVWVCDACGYGKISGEIIKEMID